MAKLLSQIPESIRQEIDILLGDRERLLELIAKPDIPEAREILKLADQVRIWTVGDEVQLRGLIEFSSFCRNHCLYCGLRQDNRKLVRYRLEAPEIITAAENGVRLGYKTVVLQSGEDPSYTGEGLAEVIREMRGRLSGQFLWGSDYPFFTPERCLTELSGLGLPPDTLNTVLRDNAERILGLA